MSVVRCPSCVIRPVPHWMPGDAPLMAPGTSGGSRSGRRIVRGGCGVSSTRSCRELVPERGRQCGVNGGLELHRNGGEKCTLRRWGDEPRASAPPGGGGRGGGWAVRWG